MLLTDLFYKCSHYLYKNIKKYSKMIQIFKNYSSVVQMNLFKVHVSQVFRDMAYEHGFHILF